MAAPVTKLLKVGFNFRQASALQDLGGATLKSLLAANFSPQQAKTLLRPNLDLKTLLVQGKFTRAQSKLILAT